MKNVITEKFKIPSIKEFNRGNIAPLTVRRMEQIIEEIRTLFGSSTSAGKMIINFTTEQKPSYIDQYGNEFILKNNKVVLK